MGRFRGSKWSHKETVLLAELKRTSVSRNEEQGTIVWEQIAQDISNTFPKRTRTARQCRRRWENLVKVYRCIEAYCILKGKQDHRELDKDELVKMTLATAYGEEWYTIVKQVFSQRNGKERSDCDSIAGKVSKGSNSGSHSGLLTEPTVPVRDTLHMTSPAPTSSKSGTASLDAHHEQPDEQSTVVNGQVRLTRPSSEVSEQGVEEEIQQDQSIKTGSELIVPCDLSHQCPSLDQQCGATNVGGGMDDDEEIFNGLSPLLIPEFPMFRDDSNDLAMNMSRLSISMVSTISRNPDSTVSDRTISRQSSGCNKLIQGLDMNSDLQSVSEEAEQQSQQCAPKVIELGVNLCCDNCIYKVKRILEKMDGVEGRVDFDIPINKVSVTASAEPEDVLKQVQMVRKDAVMWPQKK